MDNQVSEKLMLTTPVKCSYWANSGAYQDEYLKLYDELTPTKTLNGELVMAISRLGHDYYNNGNGNALQRNYTTEKVQCWQCGGNGGTESYRYGGNLDEDDIEDIFDECEECDGTGELDEEDYETEINPRFYQYLELIEKTIPNIDSVVKDVEGIINTEYGSMVNEQFSDENEAKYNLLFDSVMFYVLNNEDKELPSWYQLD